MYPSFSESGVRMRLLCFLSTSFLYLLFQSLICSADSCGCMLSLGLRWAPKPDLGEIVQWGPNTAASRSERTARFVSGGHRHRKEKGLDPAEHRLDFRFFLKPTHSHLRPSRCWTMLDGPPSDLTLPQAFSLSVLHGTHPACIVSLTFSFLIATRLRPL